MVPIIHHAVRTNRDLAATSDAGNIKLVRDELLFKYNRVHAGVTLSGATAVSFRTNIDTNAEYKTILRGGDSFATLTGSPFIAGVGSVN